MEDAFDIEEVLGRFDGDREILLEVAQIFLDEYPSLLDGLRKAVAAKDAAGLDRTAHTMKGAVSNFSPAAAAAVLKLESMGRAKDLQGAEEALTAVEGELSRLVPALQALATVDAT